MKYDFAYIKQSNRNQLYLIQVLVGCSKEKLCKMDVLMIAGLSLLSLVIMIGIVRVFLLPYHGFLNLIMQCLLLDLLVDLLIRTFDFLTDMWLNR